MIRFRLNTLAFCLFASVLIPGVSHAEPLDSAAVHAEPQYYLLALPTSPVAVIAEQVLGEALGLPFQIDADVSAEMSFKADGLFAPKALVRELGDRLFDVDVALIDRPSDGLWLIPIEELSSSVADGAMLVTSDASPTGKAMALQMPATDTVLVNPEPPPAGSAWLAWLGIFGTAAAALLSLWPTFARPNLKKPLPLAALPPSTTSTDDLIVPDFGQINGETKHPNMEAPRR